MAVSDPALHSSSTAMIFTMAAAAVIALLSLAVSWCAYQRTNHEADGETAHRTEASGGRTRFLALWGMLLGGAFAVATAMTGVAFLTLPRCAG